MEELRDYELLQKAEKEYPIGTTFICARDNRTVVTRESVLKLWDGGKSVYTEVKGSSHFEFLYDSKDCKRWATILHKPELKPLPIFN